MVLDGPERQDVDFLLVLFEVRVRKYLEDIHGAAPAMFTVSKCPYVNMFLDDLDSPCRSCACRYYIGYQYGESTDEQIYFCDLRRLLWNESGLNALLSVRGEHKLFFVRKLQITRIDYSGTEFLHNIPAGLPKVHLVKLR